MLANFLKKGIVPEMIIKTLKKKKPTNFCHTERERKRESCLPPLEMTGN